MNPLASIFDKDKLTGPNFLEWCCKLMIVLDYKRLSYILNTVGPDPVNDNTFAEEVISYRKWETNELKVKKLHKSFHEFIFDRAI